jgi:hypothetical protein
MATVITIEDAREELIIAFDIGLVNFSYCIYSKTQLEILALETIQFAAGSDRYCSKAISLKVKSIFIGIEQEYQNDCSILIKIDFTFRIANGEA